MAFRDRFYRALLSLEFSLGTYFARLFVQRLGNSTRIHASVKYWEPSRIIIGNNCEIRQGTSLDARSKKATSIIIGNGVRIKDCVNLAAYGGEINLGNNVLIGRCSTLLGHGGIYIGNDSMLGPQVTISASNHVAYLGGSSFQNQGFTREPVTVGNNVWIGSGACILAGVEIEPHTIVAAGAVVTDNLQSGWIYVGIPARPIKPISDQPPLGVPIYRRNWDLLH